jgi:hypothetical protein
VDLNANWSSQWQQGGVRWDVYYGGPRPFSERETRIARDLIVRIRPRVAIWYHQHMNVVWAFGPSTAAGWIYARLAGMPLYHHHWLAGSSRTRTPPRFQPCSAPAIATTGALHRRRL